MEILRKIILTTTPNRLVNITFRYTPPISSTRIKKTFSPLNIQTTKFSPTLSRHRPVENKITACKPPEQVHKSPSNREYERASEHELQYTQWFLTSLGLWSNISNNSTRVEKALSLITICTFIYTIIVSVIPFIMFTIIKLKTMEDRLGFLGPLEFHITNPLKYFFMVHHSDVMRECTKHMRYDWMNAVTKEEQTVMLKCANFGRSLTRLCALFMYSSAVFFLTMAILKPSDVDAFNVTIRQHILPRYDYFVNSQVSPVFEIAYCTHLSCSVFLYTIEIATCNLAAVFVGHIYGRVQVIKLKFEKFEQCANHNGGDDVGNLIAEIIHIHVDILTFVGNVRKALREMCLVEVLYSIAVMCWLEFFCLKCEAVAELTYTIDWCQIPQKHRSSLILIIALARSPRSITAGGMVEMTLRSFADVLKTSLAYFQMLRTVTG